MTLGLGEAHGVANQIARGRGQVPPCATMEDQPLIGERKVSCRGATRALPGMSDTAPGFLTSVSSCG